MGRQARFIVDKITNSIEDRVTGRSHNTNVVLITPDEIKHVHKKDGWWFNWKKEYKEPDRQVYKLIIEGNQAIQGLISLQPIPDQLYIEMHLIESAPHNRKDHRQYLGVAGNMVAFACRMSFELGFDGMVAFTAKTKLTDHYTETLGAELLYGRERMGIFTPAAKNLVNSYYKNYFGGR